MYGNLYAIYDGTSSSITSVPTGATSWVTSIQGTEEQRNINSGSGVKIALHNDAKDRLSNPKVYFSLVKSKFKETEKAVLNTRLRKLAHAVKRLELTGQQAALEEFPLALAVTLKEQEAAAIGCGRYVDKSTVTLFKKIQTLAENVYFKKLEDFPRLIPVDVERKLGAIRKQGVFDEYWVLYLDYTDEELKTNKQKIIEKDPILFGTFSFAPTRFFYIADWIDEHCDLTIDKFIDVMTENDADSVFDIEEPTPEFVQDVLEQVIARSERLAGTNRSNYRQLAAEEDRRPEEKRPWWGRLFGRR